MRIRALGCLSAIIVAWGLLGSVQAAIIVNDDFSLTKHPLGWRTVPAPGLGGIPFYLAKAPGGTAMIQNDLVFGSEALVLTAGAVSTSTPIVGNLPGTASLSNVGDVLSLSFDFRFINPDDATAANSNFRFGFHSSAGNVLTSDGPVSVTDNDTGYYVQIGTTAAATNTLFWREAGELTSILSGNDRAIITASTTVAGIADDAKHTASLTLTRTNATTISLALSIDGGATVTGTNTNLLTSFDEITFGNGFGAAPLLYAIDNVVVDATNFTPIPEPSTLGLAAAGVMGLWAFRRRKQAA